MSGIGLAYKTPEQQAALSLDAGARAVAQPPASPGIGMAKISPMADPRDIDPNVTPVPDAPPATQPPAPVAAAPAQAAAPESPNTNIFGMDTGQAPLIDFHKNPLGAIALVLGSVGAGLEGKESPVDKMRKEQLDNQAMQYKTAALAMDMVDKTSKFISKLKPGDRPHAIADLDKRFSGALGGHSIAPFLTAVTAGDEAATAARMDALKTMNVSPTMMAYFAADPAAAIKFIDGYNTHQAGRDTPEQKKADAKAVAEGTNEAGATKPMTPAEIAANKIAAANSGTSAASAAEAARHNAVEEGQSANKPMTADQSNAATFADRMHEAEAVLTKHGNELASPKGRTLDNIPGGNYAQGKNYQLAKQAKLNFLTAVLRKESGAVIGESEEKNGDRQYFPQPGDSQAVLNQKAANRATARAGISRAAGPTYKPPAPIIKYDAHGNRIPD